MKYLPYFKMGLLLLGVIAIVVAFVGSDAATESYPYLSFSLNLAYILLFATSALALLMPIIGIIQNPSGAVRSLVGVAVVLVIIGIAYAMSSDEVVKLSNGSIYDDKVGLRFTDTALFTTFFALSGVLLSIVGTEFYRIFK